MSTRRGTTGRRFVRRVTAGAVRAGVAATLATAAVVATVVTVSASNENETSYVTFNAPAVGSNGSYSVTIAYVSSYSLPLGGNGDPDAVYSFVISGANTAGCSVGAAGGSVSISGVGTCTVVATAVGDPDDSSNGGNSNGHEGPGNDPSSSSGSLTITVTHASQSISLASQSGLVGASLPLVASGYLGTGAITYALTGGTASGCAISGSSVTATSVGTCLVTASIAADSLYGAATSAPATMSFTRKTQTIKVDGGSSVVGTPIKLTASGYSGSGAITFSVVSGGTASGCSITGGRLDATSAGTCDVTATIAADSVYASATSSPTAISFSDPPKGDLIVTASSETVNAGSPVNESASVTGFTGFDTGHVTAVTFTYTGSDVSYGPSTSAPSSPGTYTVTPSNATVVVTPNSDSSKYGGITYLSGTLVIRGKLTVTASSGQITAGDSFTPSASVSGLNTGDSGSVTSASFTFTGIGSTHFGPSSSTPTAAGAYTITPANASVAVSPSAHQSLYPAPYTYAPGTLIVDPKPIVIKVNPPPTPTISMTVKPFAEGSYALTKRLKAQVMKIARAIRKAHYRVVSLTGYTDNVFTAAFDVVLDINRANAVDRQLQVDLTKLRVTGVVITVVSAATIVLVATNATAKGRAANRRVVATLKSS